MIVVYSCIYSFVNACTYWGIAVSYLSINALGYVSQYKPQNLS